MPKAYLYDDKFYFTNAVDCQKDPLESKIKGYDVFLQPGNSTSLKPLAEKEGFKVKFDVENDSWEYEEEKKDEQPEAYVPTEEDKKNTVRSQRNWMLQATDYTQLTDAPISKELKAKYKAYRTYLREYTDEENWWENQPKSFEEWNVEE